MYWQNKLTLRTLLKPVVLMVKRVPPYVESGHFYQPVCIFPTFRKVRFALSEVYFNDG